MRYIIKQSLIWSIVIIQTGMMFAAGVNVTAEFPTEVTLVLDNGTSRSKNIGVSDVFTTDAFLAGFRSIQWKGIDGHLYETSLNILGITGWTPIKIYKNNIVYIGEKSAQSMGSSEDIIGRRIGYKIAD